MSIPGSVPPSAPVTVNGVASIDDELKDFASYVKSKYPNTPSTALPRPYVDDVVHPAASEDFGINDEVAVAGGEVTVIVPLNAQVAEKDAIMLVWGKRPIAGGTVGKSEVGKYKTFKVPSKDIPEGVSTLYYDVYKNSGVSNPRSPEVSTLFRKGQPGVDGVQGVGIELAAPMIAMPAAKVIGPVEAKAGIKVTIPVYLNMNEHDVIYLYWGDVEISYTVKKTDLNKPVEILVSEADIKSAGDSQALQVYYYVEDLVKNESEWSDDAFVEVNMTASSLSAPQVLDDKGTVISTGTIDIADIGLAYVMLQIPGQFAVGDIILLHFVGTTQQGQSTAKDFGPQVVADPSKPQQIEVPYDEWLQLGGGNAQFSFTLTPKTGSPSTSKKGFINVTGAASLLPPPEINKTADDWVDADLRIINVVIPKGANLQYLDQITLYWNGTKSDGSALAIPVKKIPVTQNMVGTQIAVRLDGATFLKVLEGGFVDITYKVTRGARVFKSEQATYDIGEPAETLTAPTTEIALVNNILDPDKDEYEFNMVIEIPQSEVQPTPCTVYLHWETSQGDYYGDELEVPANSAGPYRFTVARPVYEPKGNAPVQCTVYYAIEWPGKPVQASQDLVFNVATAAMQSILLVAPVVPPAVNGKLNVTPIVDNVFPVRVDTPGLAIGDELIVTVSSGSGSGYSSGVYVVRSTGPQTVTLPLDQVLKACMSSVLDPAKYPLQVKYQWVRNGTTKTASSNILKLQLEGALTQDSFDTAARGPLKAGAMIDTPAFSATIESGRGSINQTIKSVTSRRGGFLTLVDRSQLKVELRGLAKALSFHLADGIGSSLKSQHCVIFYSASGAEIGRINNITFTRTVPGYHARETRVTFVTPASAIKSFRFVVGGESIVDIDDIKYVPF